MSPNYNALKQLMPITLGPESELGLLIEGRALDRAQATAAALFNNMFPDSCYELLPRYEDILNIDANQDASTGVRIAAVISKLRARGGLSRAYFKNLAAGMGYDIEIIEPIEAMTGWAECGDELFADDVVYWWEVNVNNVTAPSYECHMGQSGCGDLLLDFGSDDLETVFEELKPAETHVSFCYAYK